jgi:diguanylate cyclase (GGDEF)-like protein
MLQQQRPDTLLRIRFRELAFPQADYLQRKLEDHRLLFATLNFLTVLVGCLMWFWDFAMDPANAPSTLLLRLSHVVLLINVYNAIARTDRRVHVICTFLTAMWLVALYVLVLNRLSNGYVYGVGGFMYFMIMSLVLFQGFSWRFVAILSVCCAALPQLMAVLGLAPGFPHFQYSVLIWPACGTVNLSLLALEVNYIYRFRSERMLEFESNHDALTGAWNRRFFIPYLEREIVEGRKQGIAPALLIIDIDHFKKVNDSYGHPTGDRVIRSLTDIAGQVLNRNSDVFARLGGEEFSVLLPNTTIDGAKAVAERLRASFANTTHVSESGERFRCTISIGIAKGRHKGRTAERESELVTHADLALYQAKNTGRNKVCVYTEEVAA